MFYIRCPRISSEFVARVGEREAFCGDRNLQISRAEIDFQGCDPVICSKTALQAFDAIVSQGEGATQENADSHYQRFIAIREELRALKAANPAFRAGVSGGRESRVAPAGAAGRARVARRRNGRGHRRRRQQRLHADAAADLAFVSHSAAASGQGAVHRPGARPDARHGAAWRTRRAPAGGSVEPRMQCRHVVHRAARLGAHSAGRQRRQIFRRAARRNSPRPRRRWRRRRMAMRA